MRDMGRQLSLVLALLLALLLVCGAASADSVLRLATTTSTENSGLLQALLPVFEEAHGIDVQTIAVGTGKALRLGENGDVDVVMVHAQAAEEKFITNGFGVRREALMYNYFLFVGPPSDPANIKSARSAEQALAAIYARKSLFISRGDDSGTHQRERAIWGMASLKPQGNWYREAGQGMGRVLQIAGELDAYTMTDRGTWLKLGEQSGLAELFSSSPPLYNPYSIIVVNPARHPQVNYAGAIALSDWLKSAQGQALIDDYRIHGERAFIPLHLDN